MNKSSKAVCKLFSLCIIVFICLLCDIYDDRHEKVELRKYKVVE